METALINKDSVKIAVKTRQRNRGRLDIITDIIRACREGCTKSGIMLRANLNTLTASEMLETLTQCKLIVPLKEEKNIVFFPTSRGIEFLKAYETLLSFLGECLNPRESSSTYVHGISE